MPFLLMLLAAAGPAPAAVETAVAAKVRAFHGTMGVYAKNLDTGEVIAVDADRRFPTASLIKVAVMAAAGMDLQAVGPTWNNVNYAVWGGYRNPAALMNVQTGTLLIDLLDTKNNSSVFRGVAKETLNRNVSADQVADAKSVEKLIQKAVVKMFKKYPGTKRS